MEIIAMFLKKLTYPNAYGDRVDLKQPKPVEGLMWQEKAFKIINYQVNTDENHNGLPFQP